MEGYHQQKLVKWFTHKQAHNICPPPPTITFPTFALPPDNYLPDVCPPPRTFALPLISKVCISE